MISADEQTSIRARARVQPSVPPEPGQPMKVDGYNVRIVRLAGRLVPFTRGGFVCPFTDDRLADVSPHPPSSF